MDFKISYFRTRGRKGKPVRVATNYNIANRCSRSERNSIKTVVKSPRTKILPQEKEKVNP